MSKVIDWLRSSKERLRNGRETVREKCKRYGTNIKEFVRNQIGGPRSRGLRELPDGERTSDTEPLSSQNGSSDEEQRWYDLATKSIEDSMGIKNKFDAVDLVRKSRTKIKNPGEDSDKKRRDNSK